MTLRDFHRAGHTPTLLAAFLYFDVSFMVWVILGPLGPFIGEALHLSPSQTGFLIAVPLLAGSLFRPLMGALADQAGYKPTAMIGLVVTLVPLIFGWRFAQRLEHLFLMGFLLGVAGASFAVALPLASRWYPPGYQGLAMGLAGAGNSGTLLATLFVPRLATQFGWQNALGAATMPVLAVLVLFVWMARESPAPRPRTGLKQYGALLREPDTGWLCFFYSITFGGFVGLASFLTIFFFGQYGVNKVSAGDLATLAVLSGSMLRPVGGWLADRIGGYRLLLGVYLSTAACVFALAALPDVALAVVLLVAATGLLGLGNGAVFQLVPQRFPARVGTITGIVGAAGGLGGFFLPSLLGVIKDATGSYAIGLALFGCIVSCGFLALLLLGPFWATTWNHDTVRRSGLFSYRDWIASDRSRWGARHNSLSAPQRNRND